MRILHIRFKNLNSLVGEWSIDLTQPDYLSDGLFAITGPTGAGKSTILDAICLGLYGCTPRLGRITKSANDIMSRHTGECFAQITFETQHGQFESTWSQHRARKKAEGELQNPQHKLISITQKQTLAEKLLEVSREIEVVTGLDFERFTRSILLAQGSFAAFLQASADERAPILEQITGTQIYSEISIKVHERSTQERKQLTQLQAELKSLRLLDQQEEQHLREQLAQCHIQAHDLTHQIKTTEAALHWRQHLAQLEQELEQVAQNKQQLNAQQLAFEPEQKRLQQALQALELAGDYQPLLLMRKQSNELSQQQSHLEQQIPHAEMHLQQAQAALALAQQTWQQAKDESARQRPLLNQVRAIDFKLAHQHTQLQQLQTTLATHKTKQLSLSQEHNDVVQQLSTQQLLLAQVLNYLHTHAADAALVSEFAGWQQRFKHLRQLKQALHQQQKDYATLQDQQQHLAQTYEQAHQTWNQSTQQVAQLHGELQYNEQCLNQHLQGKTLSEWRNTAASIKERLQHLEQAQATLIKNTELAQLLSALQHTTQQTQTQFAQHTQALVLKQAQHETLELKVHSLTERQLFEEKIQSLEQHRHALEDNQPCPLCGALEHPFARGNLPLQSDTAKELKRAKQAVTQSNKALQTLQQDITHLQTTLATQAERTQTYQTQLSTQAQALNQLMQHLNLAKADLSMESLAALRQTTHNHYQDTQVLIEMIEKVEQALKVIHTQLATAQTTLQANNDQQQQAHFALQHTRQALQQVENQCLESAQQLQQEWAEVQALLLTFSMEELHLDHLDTLEQTLNTRRNAWLQHSEQQLQVNRSVQELTQQQTALTERLQVLANEIAVLSTELSTQDSDYHALHRQRFGLVGDASVEALEQQLTQAREQAEAQVQQQQERAQLAQGALTTLQVQWETLQHDKTNTHTKLTVLEQHFIERLQQSAFSSEAEYQAAALPETERQRLHQQAQALHLEAAELATKEQDKKLQWVALQAKQLSDSSAAALQDQCTTLQTQQVEVLQTIGALQQQLAAHQKIKVEQAKQLAAIELQRQASERWEQLAQLIGSSDGKKYRNFAQGLTFEIMIHHANRQLRKMSERYLLVRNATQPLELNVLDTYQAGEIRSTRNLSGGESFLVSLALALGLSHMASQNVRVDSLFLDEGFGTLDQEALETALETLSNLQQEGKLIGIISHVQALQERISTQIRVLPQTGGRSKLIGVGCQLLA